VPFLLVRFLWASKENEQKNEGVLLLPVLLDNQNKKWSAAPRETS
jgi:hypothetical protein